jgi:ribosome biogenesis GTPase
MIDLETYGWNGSFAATLRSLALDRCIPGRVVADYGSYLKVVIPEEITAEVSGALTHTSEPYQLPKVGDWVALQLSDHNRAVIHAVLPRRSEINRKAAGTGNARQVLATNVDVAFVVQALDFDFNPSRLERYTYQLHQSHIDPIFIFNKADKASDLSDKLAIITAMNVPFIVATATQGKGIDEIRAIVAKGKTAVFLGSSGVGKSTLTNALLGDERQKTATVRESDSMGRHTTSHREIFVLPNGGLIIDTPGIRELQLWGEEEYLSQSFKDIEDLAKGCEFRNCSHTKEENCAVLAAIDSGALVATRLESYLKFKNELQTQAFTAASLSAKQKKQRARRLRQATQLDEKLASDAELD